MIELDVVAWLGIILIVIIVFFDIASTIYKMHLDNEYLEEYTEELIKENHALSEENLKLKAMFDDHETK